MEHLDKDSGSTSSGLKPYLSPLNVWALAFGCAVGWGAFVMPGTVFLPIGGPLGVAVGMTIGGLLLLVIGYNYHYMMNHIPDTGGTYSFAKRVLGYDHGYLSAWFLALVYIAITWANATALPLVFRNILGDTFQVGFHYNVAGFDIYFGEIMLTLSAIWGFGALCMYGGRWVARLQTIMACVLFAGVLVGLVASGNSHGFRLEEMMPSFPPGELPAAAVLGIMVLAPWAFAGFESISNSTEEFCFSPRRSYVIMCAAVLVGMLVYVSLSFLAISVLPQGYDDWPSYLHELPNLTGLEGLPTFYAVHELLGMPGMVILTCTILAGVVTGMVGNFVAGSRLIYAVTRDGLLPSWFGRLNRQGTPRNAVLAMMLLSLPIPFLGRTAIGWIVDVNTIGATIAYAYTSYVTYRLARSEGNRLAKTTGIFGCAISIFFFGYFILPFFGAVSKLATESYLILIIWSILGFICFRYIFERDEGLRFGKSVVVWTVLIFLIFFTSMLWLREATQDTAQEILSNLSSYYAEEMLNHDIAMTDIEAADAEYYLQRQLDIMSLSQTKNNVLQIGLIIVALAVMFNIYQHVMHRENQLEVQKAKAEQRNEAKSRFFFNMSHDIRTPMNAIIGYTTLMKKDKTLSPEAQDFLGKIEASSEHLLSLINDILEMSRIENGKMELEIAATDIAKVADEVRDLFHAQMQAKGVDYEVRMDGVEDRVVLCDKARLNRVLLNLISNAYKFTPTGGAVQVTLSQNGRMEHGDGKADAVFVLSVKDTGIGMTPEFATKVFDSYERDRTVGNIQGTGLGMAITKSIVELMGGIIDVKTEQGKGTEFIVHVDFPIAQQAVQVEAPSQVDTQPQGLDFSKIKLLLVEDIDVNREIAMMILGEFGFDIDVAENGQIAVDKVAASSPGEYQVVLMDIQMPVMNGYEAARAIRALPDEKLASIPIIAMTANAFSEDVQNALDAGMNSHIAKPLDVTKMMETLTEVLQGQGEAEG